MKIILLLILLICISQIVYAANSTLEPDCSVPYGAERIPTLSALPAPLLNAVREHVPNLAPREAAFNGSDALRPGQSQLDRRFLLAFHRGSRWTVAYEAAGIGEHDNVVALELLPDLRTVQILGNVQTLGQTTCAEMTKFLNPDYPVSRYW